MTREIYQVAPVDFISKRDELAGEAKLSGQRELAAAIKKLRKPSVGAWLANRLAREQVTDIQGLVALGEKLRAPKTSLDRQDIVRVTKAKNEAVARLERAALADASRSGQSVSPAASRELEATLEAAFADPDAAAGLLKGCLASGLRYSGLGFDERREARARPSRGGLGGASKRAAVRAAAERALEKARREASDADVQLRQARQAVARAEADLVRLQAAETTAIERFESSQARVSAAEQELPRVLIGSARARWATNVRHGTFADGFTQKMKGTSIFVDCLYPG